MITNELSQDLTTYPARLTRPRMRLWGMVTGMSANVKEIEQKALEGRSEWGAPESRMTKFHGLPPLRDSLKHVFRANA